MNQFIGMFLPAILATYINERLIQNEMKLKVWLQKYLIFTLLINTANFTILIYFIKQVNFIFTNLFTLKYILLSMVSGLVISIIFSFIEKNMKINIRIDKNEK